MGQQLSLTNMKIPDLLTTTTQELSKLISEGRPDDVFLFLPSHVIDNLSKNSISSGDNDQKASIELPITKQTLSKQIRHDLFSLTNSSSLNEFNTEMTTLIQQVFDRISQTNTTLQTSLQSILDKENQLKKSFAEKLKDDDNSTTSIFSQTSPDSNNHDNDSAKQARLHQYQAQQLSFFAVQSLISMLLMLLKSVHQYDSTIVHQMLDLTNQLIEQIPLNYLSYDAYKRSSNLFKSLKPLTTYVTNLSTQTDIDPIAANQAMKILLNFSVIKASLKDTLPLIRKLMFNTTDIYDIRRLFVELNKDLTTALDQAENDKQLLNPGLEYLKSLEAFPSTQLLALSEKKFTGQYVSLLLFAHIDLHNQFNSKAKFDRGSLDSSFSFELTPETFKYLYEIIEQLESLSNDNFQYIIDVCQRLFTTHFHFLMNSKLDNFNDFLNENDIEKWFTFISKLAFDEKSNERKKQAIKTLIYLIEKKTSSFSKMLSFFHTYIIENKHPSLIEQLFDLLAKDTFIHKWIESFANNQETQDNTLAYSTLHSFIDIVLKPSSMAADQVKRIHDIIHMFQELLFVFLNNQPTDVSNELEYSSLSTLTIEYTTHVIQCWINEGIKSDLLEPLLLGLCALTDSKYNFAIIQPIFAKLVPIFARYIMKTMTNDEDEKYKYLISWLIGKMSHRLIVGPQQSPLEKKYSKTLKLPLFSGGYETVNVENNTYLSNLFKSDLTAYSLFVTPYRRQQSLLDIEFLHSIFNNTDQGAQLILKMKSFSRDKQRILQKSIESYANDACAALFAVYIKHFRRIDLAQHELTQPADQRPHAKLLLIYEYANQVRNVFATTKARGGDCNEVFKQIKADALLLLASVKESSFIPTIKEDFSIMMPLVKEHKLQRQGSRWSKAKHILRLLRHAMNACIRLKYLMLEKKQAAEQKEDSESVLHRAIATCIYGNDTTTTDNELKIVPDEIIKCLIRQYQRALTRLITYRFILQFIQQLIDLKENKRALNILLLSLSNVKDNSLKWHYLENIQASNNQLKEEIGHQYYLIVRKVLVFSKDPTLESHIKTVFLSSMFNLMNLSYNSMDLCHLNDFQYIQELFDSFVSFIQTNSSVEIPKELKLTAFNWFRVLVLRLCDNIEKEGLRSTTHLGSRKFHHILLQQCNLIFNKLIFTELKQLQDKNTTTEECKPESESPSLKNISINYFNTPTTSEHTACNNQYLVLLLRCIHLYEYVRMNFATINYIQQIFNIYQQSQHLNTRVLALRILRDLLIFLPENSNDTTRQPFMENLFIDILISIGQNLNPLETSKIKLDIVIELICIYRTLISKSSPWQKLASKFIIDALVSSKNFDLSSIESCDIKQMNMFLATLSILGGYIRPYCLGSTVEIFANNRSIHELESAIIVEIKTESLESDSLDITPYCVQYASNNNTEWVSSDKLRIITDILPPSLTVLPVENVIDTVLDTLGYLSQIDTSKTNSLLLLQIKRRAITAFYPLLNNKSVIDIFMGKPYASVIAKLSISVDHVDSNYSAQPDDLRVFNRLHLEQYILSLDKCERTGQIVDDAPAAVQNINGWNQQKITRDSNILEVISSTHSIDEEWKAIASKKQIQSYRQGRIGNDEIRIVPFPPNDSLPALEECGTKHKFKGRVNITDDTGNIRYPTFILDGLQLSEGNWYFCVKLLLGGAAQIGWATRGFTPSPENSRGVGEDSYSWCYDGSRGTCFHNSSTSFGGDTRWNAEDVCGCGIEIDGENTNIKYWLNGRLLGTALSHTDNKTIESTVKTNLLPNGLGSTTYFPAVTVQVYSNIANTGAFEFIFSPEDMTQCPLPKGYKPLLVPTLVKIEDTLVAYPYSSYLIGNHNEEFFYKNRCSQEESIEEKTTSMMRDFVNNQHIEVPFNIDSIAVDQNQLKLTEDSDGFPLSIDNCSSLTISFDFEIVSNDTEENRPQELDIVLFSLENEMISMQIFMDNKADEFVDEAMINRQRVAILLEANERTKVYINNRSQTLEYCHKFDPKTPSKLNLRLLPYVNAGLQNVGVWKYTLSEEHIRRLFTYSLFHIAADHQTLNEYRKRVNLLRFTKDQKHFINDTLVPFKEPFDESLWETRKQCSDHDESVYFKTKPDTNESVIQLFGNKTYLALNTANQIWTNYTLILDILIANFPLTSNPANEPKLTLVGLDTESEIYVSRDGHICVSGGQQSSSTVRLQEYIRLVISIQPKTILLYVNGTLELTASITTDQFSTKAKRIDLFHEKDSTKNTIRDNQLRIECRSIIFLNKSTEKVLNPSTLKLIKSVEYPLDKLVAPTLSLLSTSLLGIGYKEESIKYAIEHFDTTNIHSLDTILREKHDELETIYQEAQRQNTSKVLKRLTSCDEQGTLAMLIKPNQLTNESSTETDEVADNASSTENEWFSEAVHHLGIQDTLTDWMRDKSKFTGITIEDPRYKLVDITKCDSEDSEFDNELKTKMTKPLHYIHRQLPKKAYLHSRKSGEYGLITIYARYTIINMLKVWYQEDHSNLFPLAKFGDGTFIVTLLRLMDYHYTCTRTHIDETINWMKLLTMSTLKVEFKSLLKVLKNDQITEEILSTTAPFFYQLQKHVIEESIHFVSEPSLINVNNYDDETINEQMLVKQSNSDFLLKIVNLFRELLIDPEMKKYNVDLMIRLLFPNVFIRLLFDLFLLVPLHRSKIFILKLFTTLIQISENFKLHKTIQHFILKLFVELTTNTTCSSNLSFKGFQQAIMDLSFALFERQKELILGLNECPADAHNLWIVFDIINILNTRSKQAEWPELFLTQSESILGEKFRLTKELINLVQNHFDTSADGQLLKFLNENIHTDWNPLPHESITKFIEELPVESVPNSNKYASYTCLCDIPAVHIQNRAKIFYLFSILFGKLLPMIDLSLLPGVSSVTDRIRAARNYIFYTTKHQLLYEAICNTNDCSGIYQDIKFDTVKANTGESVEDTMFYQAYKQAYENSSKTFRKSRDERAWSATYVGMHSTDGGGPYRDSITQICSDICSTRLPLFILCPNGRTNSASNRDRWIPNIFPPNRPIPDDIKNQYRFVGQLIGMALRTRNLLDLKFPTLFWKQLLQEPVTIEDIEAIDMQSFTIINQMEENIKQIKCSNNYEDGDTNNDVDYLFSSIMSELTFDVVSSAGQTYELVPGGFHIPITAANFEDYCMRYREYRINEFRRQIDFIRQGLYSIVPSAYLSLYTAEELEEFVCGKGYMDIDMLKRHTCYGSDTETSPHIQRFWTVLRDMFSEEQKKLFLVFVWGRSTLPSRDEDFTSSFGINRLDVDGNVDEALPKSHTCYFSIDLPPYSTKEVMYERLNYAITYCSSIDDDGTLN